MRLAVVVIHGMGSQSESFAVRGIAELSKRLGRLDKDPAEVAWAPILWADVLRPRQDLYLTQARAANPLDWMRLRQIVVGALGDAAAYQFLKGQPSPTYEAIHDRIRQGISQLYVNVLGSQPVPLVVLAHSLGAHIMSSYIWDTQHEHDTGAAKPSSDFERLQWLAGLVTFGSTIPLFTFAHEEVVAIEFPPAALPAPVKAKARWLNFYDQDDVLGYPLKPTSQSYNETVDADIEINVGGLGISATPFSHNSYWTDSDFTTPVAEFLAEFL